MEFVTEVSEFVRLKEEPAEPEAEPERRPPGAARVHINEEPQNEHQSDSDEMEDCLQHTTSEYEIKEDPSCFENIVSDVIHGLCDGRVKDEVMQPESVPQIPQTASCSNMECVSEAAILAGLYTDHDVKDELVLGAECPYRPDVTLVVHGRIGHTLRDCSVTLEHIPHIDVLAKRQGTTSSDTESDTDKFTFRDEFHTEEKEPLCDLCGERFSVKSDLVKHVIDHIHRPPSMEQEASAQGNAFAGQCQQEQERALCRKYAIQDCRVRLERLRHQEALAANDTQHTDTEIDAEDIHTRVDNGKPTCGLCGDSFALKSDLDQHIMTHIHMPTAQRSQDPSPEKESDTEEKNVDIDCENEPTCEFCGEKFALDSDLMKHVMRHINVDRTKQLYEKSGVHMYECDICGETFHQKNTLKIHIETHSTQSKSKDSKCDNIGEKSYCCEICAERFRSRYLLNKHRRVHPNIYAYYCDVCKKRFKTAYDFKNHIGIHSDIGPYSCEVCKKQFKTDAYLKLHTQIHRPTQSYSCDVCKRRFRTKATLKRHILTHIRPYSCDICKKGFLTVNSLKQHTLHHSVVNPHASHSCDIKKEGFLTCVKKHTGLHSDIGPYYCDVCGKRFISKRNLERHIGTHSVIKQNTCSVYREGFVTLLGLKQHTQMVRADVKPYSCNTCKKRFRKAYDLKIHAQIHGSTKPYSCDVCKKGFSNMSHLKGHTVVHTDIRPYSCDVCNKRFKIASHLKEHTQIHRGTKPYSCDLCKNRFRTKSKLKRHTTFHSDMRPYSCDVCKKGFRCQSNLNEHILIHSDLKPYSCDVCKKAFRTQSNLKIHTRIHSDMRPYSCDVCKKAFRTQSNLNKHTLIHSDMKPYSCDVCNKGFRSQSNLKRHNRTQIHSDIDSSSF